MTTQNMDMVKDKFQDAKHFIQSLSLKDEDVIKIINANDWEKDFILQRAKELFIPFFEEFINNFESVRVIIYKRKLNRGRRTILKDLETGIVYESLSDVAKDVHMSFNTVRRHIEKGRFVVLGRTFKDKRLEGKDAVNKNV
ncbi:MAG: hypothetical protein SOR11_07550 [Fusobacterium sp.]|uniref:hypothetical protein n=1 Tax=Fusobacterium sp. TaxID=68766 RepID=UPI002A76396F|nr:hypothetical protein [Fusobacterium sp.]MDY3059837.1 hypothetical protein [Fusobacterium sp.]